MKRKGRKPRMSLEYWEKEEFLKEELENKNKKISDLAKELDIIPIKIYNLVKKYDIEVKNKGKKGRPSTGKTSIVKQKKISKKNNKNKITELEEKKSFLAVELMSLKWKDKKDPERMKIREKIIQIKEQIKELA